MQLAGQFALSNIMLDSTKFYYVISQLDNKYVVEMEDIITNPPPTGRYDQIKTELMRRLSLPKKQRERQLLMHEEMGDRRPTQFLRHLRTFAGPSVPSDSLRTLWMDRLPPNIQAIIAMWFMQLEGQFALSNIMLDSTKFYYVISQLDKSMWWRWRIS